MSRYKFFNRIFPKVMAVMLVLSLMLSVAPGASAAELSGTCGGNLNWSFADGTLTITGRGEMNHYESAEAVPWHSLRNQIQEIILPEGLTRIGSEAFREIPGLTAVTIPSTVQVIERRAFYRCANLSILTLNEGLTEIGRSVFKECPMLQDVRLPETLRSMDRHAFYGCESLQYLTVPRSVQTMGDGVFAYCTGLIRADVLAPLEELPSWTFYGCKNLIAVELADETKSIGLYAVRECENLQTIYYGGEEADAKEIAAQIEGDNEYYKQYGSIGEEDPAHSEVSSEIVVDEYGSLLEIDITTTQTEDSTITVTETNNLSNSEDEQRPTDITATIVTDDGWQELVDAVGDALEDGGSVNADIYISNGTEIPEDVLNELAGKDIQMDVTSSQGDSYTLDFQQMEDLKTKKPLDLSYNLKLLENVKYEQLKGITVYELTFEKSSQIPVGAAIQLPTNTARKITTLYQIKGGKLEWLQSAVVDQNGVAHFYLATVDKGTTYLVGVDVPGVSTSDANIPQSLEKEYGITEQIKDVDYVITGRKSSWGVSFFEVNQIMIIIMLGSAVFIGLMMYARNKRKLRQGYVPGWEDSYDEDEN